MQCWIEKANTSLIIQVFIYSNCYNAITSMCKRKKVHVDAQQGGIMKDVHCSVQNVLCSEIT